MYFLLLQNSDKRKHKREVHFFRHTKVQRRWIQNWMQMKMENIKKWHILAAISNKFLHFLAVPKKIRLLLLLTVILRMSGDCWRTYREQWHLLPDFDAASTEEQISSLVRHFRANQNLFWTRTPLNAENGMSEGGPDCKLFNLKKSSIIAGNETHKFCLIYILYRITRWGGGKSTSIMQSPAAYTLPVKLLTSTNDFLMIGPLSHKAVYSQTVTLTHIHCALHTFAPSRTHTHTHNEFYQGKYRYIWFNGSLPMPYPLTLLYCCKFQQDACYFPHVTYFSEAQRVAHEYSKWLCTVPRVKGAKLTAEQSNK